MENYWPFAGVIQEQCLLNAPYQAGNQTGQCKAAEIHSGQQLQRDWWERDQFFWLLHLSYLQFLLLTNWSQTDPAHERFDPPLGIGN